VYSAGIDVFPILAKAALYEKEYDKTELVFQRRTYEGTIGLGVLYTTDLYSFNSITNQRYQHDANDSVINVYYNCTYFQPRFEVFASTSETIHLGKLNLDLGLEFAFGRVKTLTNAYNRVDTAKLTPVGYMYPISFEKYTSSLRLSPYFQLGGFFSHHIQAFIKIQTSAMLHFGSYLIDGPNGEEKISFFSRPFMAEVDENYLYLNGLYLTYTF
jgi:hypothetical protein